MRIAAQLERAGRVRHLSPVAGGSVKVHIEELVLHGFASGDRHQIAAAVQQELARLMSVAGTAELLKNPSAAGKINGGTFRVKAGARPQAAGKEIAGALFRGMRQHLRTSGGARQARPEAGGRRA